MISTIRIFPQISINFLQIFLRVFFIFFLILALQVVHLGRPWLRHWTKCGSIFDVFYLNGTLVKPVTRIDFLKRTSSFIDGTCEYADFLIESPPPISYPALLSGF